MFVNLETYTIYNIGIFIIYGDSMAVDLIYTVSFYSEIGHNTFHI